MEKTKLTRQEKKQKKREEKERKKNAKDRIHRLRKITPYARIVPYIMENRCGSQNFVFDKIYLEKIDKYIKQKQAEGLKNFGLMHLIIAAYVRAVSQRPGINRFIRGQKIYSRNKVEISFVIKKEMTLESPDTVIKVLLDPSLTAEEIYNIINDKVEGYRNAPNSSFDKLAKVLNFIPGLLLRWTVRFLRFIDYFGLLPKFLRRLSPFHASLFITSMGSLGIPPIVHHLYDFGTVPVFCSFGAVQREYKLNAKGDVVRRSYVEITYNLDERICDGFYYASAMKYIRTIFKNPTVLDTPPETVIKDIK